MIEIGLFCVGNLRFFMKFEIREQLQIVNTSMFEGRYDKNIVKVFLRW